MPESSPDINPAPGALAQRVAAALLASLELSTGATDAVDAAQDSIEAARDWAASGLLWLSGDPRALPSRSPHAVPTCVRGALRALQQVAGRPLATARRGAGLLSERAALLGLSRGGMVSANGSCRLLPARDGYIALNLARADDRDLLPAWLQEQSAGSGWAEVAALMAAHPAAALVDRGRLLGMPLAPTRPAVPVSCWYRVVHPGRGVAAPSRSPRVVDLSALWAGPLCTQLLREAGARVVKVESLQRPDGARRGSPGFFDLLNHDKDSVALDFGSADGLAALRRLLDWADIVVESARPRALRQLGIHAEDYVEKMPGKVWLGFSGYGRCAPQDNWVAFGDDAAVAAGLYLADGGRGQPAFIGDALADPLAGVHGALAALALWRRGRGGLVDVNLHDVVAWCRDFHSDADAGAVAGMEEGPALRLGDHCFPVRPPRHPGSAPPAAQFGADTARVLGEVAMAC